ncbi:2,5-diketo-D-gluconate reductase A [Hamadaea flava]|uniref:Aldo/keto reductase n=1 Tax=Hamadaea flava TaxID=1742688 RepID=A0ABV8LMH1_9ACTN|nr:aldo/keto reductase [Hamadaea flava]MCP2323174.1 2,5-diketo-D-gluconate reductase A [Hamadaea flava]
MNAIADQDGGRTRVLSDGNRIPVLGLGVWQVPNGPDCVNAVRWALEVGYRHIDTAQAYGNEESVGQALRESEVPRDEVFLTTKFHPRGDDPVEQARRSLRRLGVDQVDLYVIHWPAGGPTWAWSGMERTRELGLARSIGVSNFSAAEVDSVVAASTVPPALNQVMFNPWHRRTRLVEACDRHGVAVEAYSPLGTGRYLDDPTVAEIAQRIARTPAQVLLRWAAQHGLVVIPKSTHRDRIAQNAQIFDFVLSAADMGVLDGLDQTSGTDQAQEHKWW